MLFFVYGGLMKEMGLSEYMKNSVYKGPAFIYADLYFLGQFPGVRPGKNKVFGELYEINEKSIPEIDKIEKYYPNNTAKSIYLRKELNVFNFADGKKIKASVYWYNKTPQKNHPLIKHGDYRRFIEEKKQSATSSWIVSYGSNLSQQRIEKRVGKINENKIGFLNGFSQVFNVKTNLNGYAYANIKFSGNDKCPVVAWKLSAEQIEKLDKYEDVPNRYHRISMPFTDKNGKKVIAQTYIANINTLGENLHPESNYLKYITDGLKELEL